LLSLLLFGSFLLISLFQIIFLTFFNSSNQVFRIFKSFATVLTVLPAQMLNGNKPKNVKDD